MTESDSAFRQLLSTVADELRAAVGDPERLERVIRRYIEDAYPFVDSPFALWDYFCISWPGVVDKAGYAGEAREAVIEVYERVSRSVFNGS